MLSRIAVSGIRMSNSCKSRPMLCLQSFCGSYITNNHHTARRTYHYSIGNNVTKSSGGGWAEDDSIPFGDANGWDTEEPEAWGIHGGPAESPLAGKNLMCIEELT